MQQPASHLSLAPTPAAPDVPDADEPMTGAEEPAATTAQPVTPSLEPVVVPSERRPRWTSLAVLAAACGLGAVVLGIGAVLWPASDPSPAPAAGSPALEKAVVLLADPAVERITFAGSLGRLVLLVGRRGDAVLALNGLGAAPEGRIYQAWVTQPGPGETVPAGLFDGSERLVALTVRVARGAQVSVTLENAGGADAPSRAPRLYAVRPVSDSKS